MTKVASRPAAKKVSKTAAHAHRSAAQKAAVRMARVSTSVERAKTIKTVEAKPGQETAYDLLKKIWSSRGEIFVTVKGIQVEAKRADVIRQLKALPREAKSPFKLTSLNEKAHILA